MLHDAILIHTQARGIASLHAVHFLPQDKGTGCVAYHALNSLRAHMAQEFHSVSENWETPDEHEPPLYPNRDTLSLKRTVGCSSTNHSQASAHPPNRKQSLWYQIPLKNTEHVHWTNSNLYNAMLPVHPTTWGMCTCALHQRPVTMSTFTQLKENGHRNGKPPFKVKLALLDRFGC